MENIKFIIKIIYTREFLIYCILDYCGRKILIYKKKRRERVLQHVF